MTSTTENRTDDRAAVDPRPAFARAVDLAADVAAAIGPEHLDAPTPCDGMDVRSLLDHLAMALGRAEAAGRGTPLAEWPGEEVSAGDDWAAGLRRAGDAAVAAWSRADARLTEPIQLPWDTLPGAEALGIYLNEVLVHAWDLARATGQSPAWDDEVVAVADACIRRQLPMAERGPMWDEAKAQLPEGVPWEDPFADAVPVSDGAPAIDRLVAWNGRRP